MQVQGTSSSPPTPTHQLRSITHVCKCKEHHHPHPPPPISCVASHMCASARNIIIPTPPTHQLLSMQGTSSSPPPHPPHQLQVQVQGPSSSPPHPNHPRTPCVAYCANVRADTRGFRPGGKNKVEKTRIFTARKSLVLVISSPLAADFRDHRVVNDMFFWDR